MPCSLLAHSRLQWSTLSFFYRSIRPQPISTLFPYTTLFRSDTGIDGNLRREKARVADAKGNGPAPGAGLVGGAFQDRKSTRLNSSHTVISYAVFCLKKKRIANFLERLASQWSCSPRARVHP